MELPKNFQYNETQQAKITELPPLDTENTSQMWSVILGVKVTNKTGWTGSSPEEMIELWSDTTITLDEYLSRLGKSQATLSKFAVGVLTPRFQQQIQEEQKKVEVSQEAQKKNEKALKAIRTELLKENNHRRDEHPGNNIAILIFETVISKQNTDVDCREYVYHITEKFAVSTIEGTKTYRLLFRNENFAVCRDWETAADFIVGRGDTKLQDYANQIWKLKELKPAELDDSEIIKHIAAMNSEKLELFGVKAIKVAPNKKKLYAIKGKYGGAFGPLPIFEGNDD